MEQTEEAAIKWEQMGAQFVSLKFKLWWQDTQKNEEIENNVSIIRFNKT